MDNNIPDFSLPRMSIVLFEYFIMLITFGFSRNAFLETGVNGGDLLNCAYIFYIIYGIE